FVVVVSYSRWPEVVPLTLATSGSTIEALDRISLTHGLPKTLVSDNGAQFTSTPHHALGEKSPPEVIMGRKLRSVQKAMLPKKTLPNRRGSQKNGIAVNTPIYVRDYRLGHEWTATIITKRHGSTICDVKFDKDTWVRHPTPTKTGGTYL
ncbi:unnamed protein product, partial [Hymenolepis diminuta]